MRCKYCDSVAMRSVAGLSQRLRAACVAQLLHLPGQDQTAVQLLTLSHLFQITSPFFQALAFLRVSRATFRVATSSNLQGGH